MVMQLQNDIRIADCGGRGYATIKSCSLSIDKTFSGYDLRFNFEISSFEISSNVGSETTSIELEDLHVDLYVELSQEKVLLGRMLTKLVYIPSHELVQNYKFSLGKSFYILTNDFIRLIDQTYGGDVVFSFDVMPVLRNSQYQMQQESGSLRIPQSEWLQLINKLDLDRFELITIRVPVASSHLHKPFADAIAKIREAENLYQRGELLGAAVACRAAWNTVLSSAPPSTPKIEHMLSTVTGDPRRKEFALAVLRGFHDVVNKGVHLEGDAKTGTPPADLKPEDILLCIHWYSAAIGYLSSTST